VRLLAPDLRVEAVLPLPPDWDPVALGCAAFGLVVPDAASPRVLVQPWGGDWQGYRVPGADPGDALVSLAADPAFPRAVALLRGAGGPHRLLVVSAGAVTLWDLPLVREPLHLILTAPDLVLVGQPTYLPGDRRPFFVRQIRLGPGGPEAEAGFAVRGFDGRALWLQDGQVYASTAEGARALYQREQALGGEGVVETYALDSGIFACVWHRLFLDLCLPPDCALSVEARTADDLPPFEIRRGRRLPVDLVPSGGSPVVAPAVDDPWPPLGSLVAGEGEGWVSLGIADARPARADIPLPGIDLERPSEDPLAQIRATEVRTPDRMETRELLITAPPGRYLWLRIRLRGTSRRGPALFALRASLPRPSLLDYLPAYWRADPQGGDATERALALFEGWTTELDGRIEALRRLVDPRLAPAGALDWLASFVALVLDQRVREGVRRQLLGEIATLYRARGTVPGLSRLLSILAEARVQVIEGFRLRRPSAAFVGEAALGPALEIGGREGGFDLAGGEAWEADLASAHAALLLRRAAETQPCPAQSPPDPFSDDPLIGFYRRHAHRFTVVVPRPCDALLQAVLELAIETHKPAHTIHRLCWLDAGYRVGSASLVGISHLGAAHGSAPAVLGDAVLSSLTTLHRGRHDGRYPTFQSTDPRGTAP
jgi:phage tail-like protein